jgi:hypothetical protein
MSTQALKAFAAGGTTDSVFADLLSRPHRTFDPDAYHVMQERDDQLIRDNLLHGTANREFVYSFSIKGTTVTGISVIGARQLAAEYKGIKQRIVASTEKRGALFIFRTFEPLGIETRELPDLASDPDFYEVVMEISDIKTGNSVQVRKSETKLEKTRDGKSFERPHYSTIAESKAYRNGVLAVLPQSVIIEFERKSLNANNKSDELTIEQLRERTAAFCAKQGITLIRGSLTDLTYGELRGLASAANTSIDAFREAAQALGVLATLPDQPQKKEKPEKRQNPAAPTEDTIRASLEKAASVDILDVAADLISAVEDEAAQQRLTALYNERREALTA